MTFAPVVLPQRSATNEKPHGPATIEHLTADCGLSELGTYIMEFHAAGHTDPWTVRYEETIYVLEGCARLIVHENGGTREVTAHTGALIVLPKGSTVQYGALIGTRLLLSISPVNWQERS
ncbi:hypothetical protein ABT381_06970 [Streptomyces sp. NPDC000151]|uniref:hypothetical protein n=1 Tax=Streptomyces sp. NPDC000151 TaxID=3154244 RepID=UPI0033207808